MADDDIFTSVDASTPPVGIPSPRSEPAPAEPPQADKVPPPVIGPLAALAQSRKFIFALVLIVGAFVLVGIGRITWEQLVGFVSLIGAAFLGAHGLEEGLAKLGKKS